jgi:hypothetical protein
MKNLPFLLLIVGSLASAGSAFSQTVIYGGDYVSGNVAFARADNTLPIDVSFNTTAALSPATSYTGPIFYGGYVFTNTGAGNLSTNTGATQRVRNDGTSDPIEMQAVSATAGINSYVGSILGSVVFQLAGPVSYGDLTNLTANTSSFRATGLTGDSTFRLVLGNSAGTSWVISDTSVATGTLSLNPAGATWNAFDTSSFAIGATTAAPSTVGYVGYYFLNSFDGNITDANQAIANSRLLEYSLDVIPEPSSLGLLTAGLLALLAAKRRRA